MNIDETIAEVLRLDAQATPGPWGRWRGEDRTLTLPYGVGRVDASTPVVWSEHPGCGAYTAEEDEDLISFYRTAAPALAREVRRLQIILEACDERSQMCLEAEEEADAELRAALDEIDRLRACALPSEGAYISGRVDGERIGFRAGQEVMRERAAALCRARAEVNEQTVAEADEAEYLADAIRALEVRHD